MRSAVRLPIAVLVGVLCACQGEEPWNGQVPTPDYAQFEAQAYPVLLRDCAFGECHGREGRLFRVWGPGRVRLDPAMRVDDGATPQEIQKTYARARSMLASETSGKLPPLLGKPLEERAGGMGHRGTDAFGRNVYQSSEAAGFVTLLGWARSLGTGPVAVPPAPAAAPSAGGAPAGAGTVGGQP